MKIKLCFLAIFFLIVGCATKTLVYRADFEEKKLEYYNKCLAAESEIQKKNIIEIEKKLKNLMELCFVLYHRLPSDRDQYNMQLINLRLWRLKESLKTFENMRKNFTEGFELALTNKEYSKTLEMQYNLELEYLRNASTSLFELRAVINYMDRFRKKAMIISDKPEEKLQNVEKSILRLEEEMNDFIYKDFTEYLKNVGIVSTKDAEFKFSFNEAEKPKDNADKVADEFLLSAGDKKLLDDVSGYSYYFTDEEEEFELSFKNLKDSVERFKKAVKDYEAHNSKSTGNISKPIINQLNQTTNIMENMLIIIEKNYKEASTFIKSFVGIDYIDYKFWTKTKTETDEQRKPINFKYFMESVLILNNTMKDNLSLEKKDSEFALLAEHLSDLTKSFNEKGGIWGTGYDFLSPEWQAKISFDTLEVKLRTLFGKIEKEAQEGLRPLWKSCHNHFYRKNKSKEAPYIIGNEGYLVPNPAYVE